MDFNLTCLIPAAGKGTRMRPLTNTLPKAMLPIAGKPAIFHIIDRIKSFGVKRFIVITGYLGELIEKEVLKAYTDLEFIFIEQKEQKGLGHAIQLASSNCNNYPLLIIYGDTLFECDLRKVLQSNKVMIGAYKVKNPSQFGIIELANDHRTITKFIEKPDNPTSNLALPGVNYFPSSEKLFKAMQEVLDRDIKTKDEYQITDAYQLMISEMNVPMEYFIIDKWYDTGTLEAILSSNKEILKTQKTSHNFQEVIIHSPVYIDDSAKIQFSEIGPFVSIGKNVQVLNSKISCCIIDNESEVHESELTNSLIGRKVKLTNLKGSAVIGDNSSIQNEL